MAIRIITDSSCDIPFSLRDEWQIDIMPMVVNFGEKEYLDGKDLNASQFYTLLSQADELPKTAQLTPIQFENIIRPYAEAGDSVIVLPISKELSGTYNNALIAKESFPDAEIEVIDTLSVTFSLYLLVRIAVQLRDSGYSFKEITEQINDIKGKIRLYAVIGDLKYLRMGGRLSSAVAVVGSILGIKPIINVLDGKVNNIDKVRGMRAGYQCVADYVAGHGIDTRYPVAFGHSELPEIAAELMEIIATRMDFGQASVSSIGPIVGAHVGPGATGVAFIAKNPNP